MGAEPSEVVVRPAEPADFSRGHLQLLGQLT